MYEILDEKAIHRRILVLTIPAKAFLETLSKIVYHSRNQRNLKGMSDPIAPYGVPDQEQDEVTLTQEPAKVILFNDDIHTFDEVIGQVIKAIHCDSARAEAIAWEVHTSGKAMVYEGPMPECLKVSHILEEISLHTQIEV